MRRLRAGKAEKALAGGKGYFFVFLLRVFCLIFFKSWLVWLVSVYLGVFLSNECEFKGSLDADRNQRFVVEEKLGVGLGRV